MTGLLHELILPCVYAFFGSLGFSFVFNLHGKNILYAAIGGGISWFVYLITAGWFSSDVPQFFLSMGCRSPLFLRSWHGAITRRPPSIWSSPTSRWSPVEGLTIRWNTLWPAIRH